MDAASVQALKLEVRILELLDDRIALHLVLEVHHLVISDDVGVLVAHLYEGLAVLHEVGNGVIKELELNHSQMWWHESVTLGLFAQSLCDQLLRRLTLE